MQQMTEGRRGCCEIAACHETLNEPLALVAFAEKEREKRGFPALCFVFTKDLVWLVFTKWSLAVPKSRHFKLAMGRFPNNLGIGIDWEILYRNLLHDSMTKNGQKQSILDSQESESIQSLFQTHRLPATEKHKIWCGQCSWMVFRWRVIWDFELELLRRTCACGWPPRANFKPAGAVRYGTN